MQPSNSSQQNDLVSVEIKPCGQNNGETLHDMGVDALLDLLEKKKFRHRVIQKLNDHIDIPFITESTEASIIDALYGVILSALKDSLQDDH